jgi:endonuclease/exonuclease/phosphatase family metal-dependent hydrolase
MIGRQFTWANSLTPTTYEKLDRILMDSESELKYHTVSVRVLPRIESLSDHAPILITTNTPRPPSKRSFKFELEWLQREGF